MGGSFLHGGGCCGHMISAGGVLLLPSRKIALEIRDIPPELVSPNYLLLSP